MHSSHPTPRAGRAIAALLGALVVPLVLVLPAHGASGDLDPTFASTGKVVTSIPGATSFEPVRVAVQADGRIVTTGAVRKSGGTGVGLTRHNADGSLDTSFGTGGTVSRYFGDNSTPVDVAVQPDGRILVLTKGLVVARFNRDGTLDDAGPADSTPGEGFGTGGRAGGGPADNGTSAMALQADGKILALGWSESAGMVLIRLLPTGAADTSFGNASVGTTLPPVKGGVVTSNAMMAAYAVAVAKDGRIIVAGTKVTMRGFHELVTGDFAIIRLTADGKSDATFGTSGTTVTDFTRSGLDPSAKTIDEPAGVVIQSDGRIVVVGTSSVSPRPAPLSTFQYLWFQSLWRHLGDFAVARYSVDGDIEPASQKTIDFGGNDVMSSVAARPDDGFVATGSTQASSGASTGAVARFGPDTSLDAGFGTGGQLTLKWGTTDDSVRGAAVQPDGNIVVAGPTRVSTEQNPAGNLLACSQGVACSGGLARLLAPPPPNSLSVADISVVEGNVLETRPAVFTVRLSGPVAVPVTVNYTTVSRTASDSVLSPIGADFIPMAGTLTFAPGSALAQNVTVTVNGDPIPEPDEIFELRLSGAVGAPIARTTATTTIHNDDNVLITVDDMTVAEGDAGTTTQAYFVARLSHPNVKPVTVDYATMDATATAGADYLVARGTVSFSPGETAKGIPVGIIGDNTLEPDEAFVVSLSNSSNSVVLSRVARATIVNDDTPNLITVSDVTATEGPSATTKTFDFQVQLSSLATKAVSVDYATMDGTATGGSDYVPTSGRLVIAPGNRIGTVSVTVNGDSTTEPDETFFLNLSNSSNGAAYRRVGIGTIKNDD